MTYKTLNEWNQKGQTEKSGKYFEFAQHIKKCNADGARKLLEKLNDAAKPVIVKFVCGFWREDFPEDFARRQYSKTNVVSENINPNVEIVVQDTNEIRKEILAKFTSGREIRSFN